MIYASSRFTRESAFLQGLGKNAPESIADMKIIYGDRYSDENQTARADEANANCKDNEKREPVHWGFGQYAALWIYHRGLVKDYLGEDLEEFPLDAQYAEIFNAVSDRESAIRESWRKAEEDKKKNQDKSPYERWLDSVPPRFKDADVVNFKKSKDVIDHICQGGSALIIGGVGTKKTTLLWAMAKECAKGTSPDYVRVMKLADILSEVRTSGEDWNEEIQEIFSNVTFLFIDEIDKVEGNESDRNLLFALIDSRYEQNLPTVCVGNGNEDRIEKKLGKAVVSRLKSQKEGGMLVELNGPDMRIA